MKRRSFWATALTIAALGSANALVLTGCTSDIPASSAVQESENDNLAASSEANSTDSSVNVSEASSADASPDEEQQTQESAPDTNEDADFDEQLTDQISVHFSSYEQNLDLADKIDGAITLNKDSISGTGKGYTINQSTLTIISKGTYEINGELIDGQIIVDVPETDKVRLILNNTSVSSSSSAPIYVKSAKKVVLNLAPNSQNSFLDAATRPSTESELSACVFCTCDLTVNGSGALTITGNYKNALGSKDDLKILGGTLTLSAEKNAIKGNDSVVIDQATITATAGKDAIKSDKEGNFSKGYIYMKSGSLTLTAGDDALQAFNAVIVKDGSILTTQDGKQVNCDQLVDIADGCLQ